MGLPFLLPGSKSSHDSQITGQSHKGSHTRFGCIGGLVLLSLILAAAVVLFPKLDRRDREHYEKMVTANMVRLQGREVPGIGASRTEIKRELGAAVDNEGQSEIVTNGWGMDCEKLRNTLLNYELWGKTGSAVRIHLWANPDRRGHIVSGPLLYGVALGLSLDEAEKVLDDQGFSGGPRERDALMYSEENLVVLSQDFTRDEVEVEVEAREADKVVVSLWAKDLEVEQRTLRF